MFNVNLHCLASQKKGLVGHAVQNYKGLLYGEPNSLPDVGEIPKSIPSPPISKFPQAHRLFFEPFWDLYTMHSNPGTQERKRPDGTASVPIPVPGE